MRRLALLILYLLIPLTAFGVEMLRQDLEVRIFPEQQEIEVRAILSPAHETFVWPESFRLTSQARELTIMLNGNNARYRFDKGMLQIPAIPAGAIVTMHYRARFTERPPENTVGIENPSFGITATVTPDGTYISGASAWHPIPGHHQGFFRIKTIGPPGLIGVTGGKFLGNVQTESLSATTWETSLPQTGITLAAGQYLIGKSRLEEIELLTFFRPGNHRLADGYLESCRKYLQVYQELFGPYPYPSYSIVENFYPTGYGLPGWTLLGSSVINLPFIRYTSLPHEIAHAWWGNAIEIDYASGNWGEGLATYVADYYLKELSSETEALEYRRKILNDYAILAAGSDYPLTDFRSRLSKRDQAIGYGKAAMVFHMLRQRLGDEAFWGALQQTSRTGVGRTLSWDDLRNNFEQASGLDLGSFFDQWLNRRGGPRIELSSVNVNRKNDGWQVSGTVLQDGPAYELQLPIRLNIGGKTIEQDLSVNSPETEFSLTTDDFPTELMVDPEGHIFRLLSAVEIPATINNLRAAEKPLVVIAGNSLELYEQSADLLRGLQWQLAEVVPEDDFNIAEHTDRDILYIGRPRIKPLPATLPGSIDIQENHFSINGQRYENSLDALFVVLGAGNSHKTIAYYLPNSPLAAADNARRIPHYGRYSYLVFRSGKNIVKRTWEPSNSPLKATFKKR